MGNHTATAEKYWQMEVTSKASGRMAGDTAKVKKFLAQERFQQENGNTITLLKINQPSIKFEPYLTTATFLTLYSLKHSKSYFIKLRN